MIARTWRGAVRPHDADAYLAYLRQTGLADYAAQPGHLATLALRRIDGGAAEYLLLTLWSSPEAVRGFAGADAERAVFYPRDDDFLIERDVRVRHFEAVFADGLVLEATPASGPNGISGEHGPPGWRDSRRVRPRGTGLPGSARAVLGWWWHGLLGYVATLARPGGIPLCAR